MAKAKRQRQQFLMELSSFGRFLRVYARSRVYRIFSQFEQSKQLLVDLLYKRRGKYARPVLHLGAILLGFVVVALGPYVLRPAQPGGDEAVLGQVAQLDEKYDTSFYTVQAEEVRQFRGGEIIRHVVAEGETLSSIAERYNLDVSTILWENDLTEKSTLKPGQELSILPVDGVKHEVKRGETIYSIGKKYKLDENQVQAIIDYPFNEFLNDETFELASGQILIVPGGVKQAVGVSVPVARSTIYTPDAGTVTASGSFIWPAAGRITQGYFFYHRAIDIANQSGGAILAADSGTVIVAGWPDNSGYGNRVIIDHGNGFASLYAHLRAVQVRAGQRVSRGDVIGQMGSTGRSTGTHLHFEIRQGANLLNPLSFLQ